MKATRLLAAAAIGVFLASTSIGSAVVYTPAKFAAELESRVGTKRNSAAYNAAAYFLKIALRDKSNKGLARTYMTLVVKALEDSVRDRLQPRARNTLVIALLGGYFKGTRFNLTDQRFLGALRKALAALPESGMTIVTVQLISDTIESFMFAKGMTEDQIDQANVPAMIYEIPGLPPHSR